MSTKKERAASQIKDLEVDDSGKSAAANEHDSNSSEVGGSAPAKAKRVALKGMEARKFQRHNNINGLDGLIREHARLIALIRNGEIALDRGEVLSRAYGRHKDMVTAREQRTELSQMLEALQRIADERRTVLTIDSMDTQ